MSGGPHQEVRVLKREGGRKPGCQPRMTTSPEDRIPCLVSLGRGGAMGTIMMGEGGSSEDPPSSLSIRIPHKPFPGDTCLALLWGGCPGRQASFL